MTDILATIVPSVPYHLGNRRVSYGHGKRIQTIQVISLNKYTNCIMLQTISHTYLTIIRINMMFKLL